MISGADIRRLRWFLAGCALAAASAPPALAQSAPVSWGLPQLMQEMARVHSATASFTERRTAPVLSAPLLSQGTLTYEAPDYMRKTTATPVPEDFVLDNGRITMTGGPDGATHHFALTDDPRIGGLVEGIRATLAGDLPALEHYYTLSLGGSAANWQLSLQPRNPALQHFIQSIVIHGQQDRIASIDTLSRDGGESLMNLGAEAVNDAP